MINRVFREDGTPRWDPIPGERLYGINLSRPCDTGIDLERLTATQLNRLRIIFGDPRDRLGWDDDE